MSVYYIHVTPDEAGQRLDIVLSAHISSFSRREIRQIISDGGVAVNRRRITRLSFIPRENDIIRLIVNKKKNISIGSLPILYQDSWILAVDKPAGIASDATASGKQNTIVAFLQKQFPGLKYLEPVHRLDQPVSGIILLSKKPAATKILMEQFRQRQVKKEYLAVVSGCMLENEGKFESYLATDPTDKRKSISLPNPDSTAKHSVTKFRVLGNDADKAVTYVHIDLLTGRKHQIRVHFASRGHPVVGDWLYGSHRRKQNLMLHSWRLTFVHPNLHKVMVLSSNPDRLSLPSGIDLPEAPKESQADETAI